MYKEKLKLLLKALEVREIDDFIDESPALIAMVGTVIAKAAKRGAKDAIRCEKCGEPEPVLCCENCGHKWPRL